MPRRNKKRPDVAPSGLSLLKRDNKILNGSGASPEKAALLEKLQAESGAAAYLNALLNKKKKGKKVNRFSLCWQLFKLLMREDLELRDRRLLVIVLPLFRMVESSQCLRGFSATGLMSLFRISEAAVSGNLRAGGRQTIPLEMLLGVASKLLSLIDCEQDGDPWPALVEIATREKTKLYSRVAESLIQPQPEFCAQSESVVASARQRLTELEEVYGGKDQGFNERETRTLEVLLPVLALHRTEVIAELPIVSLVLRGPKKHTASIALSAIRQSRCRAYDVYLMQRLTRTEDEGEIAEISATMLVLGIDPSYALEALARVVDSSPRMASQLKTLLIEVEQQIAQAELGCKITKEVERLRYVASLGYF